MEGWHRGRPAHWGSTHVILCLQVTRLLAQEAKHAREVLVPNLAEDLQRAPQQSVLGPTLPCASTGPGQPHPPAPQHPELTLARSLNSREARWYPCQGGQCPKIPTGSHNAPLHTGTLPITGTELCLQMTFLHSLCPDPSQPALRGPAAPSRSLLRLMGGNAPLSILPVPPGHWGTRFPQST